MAEKNTQLAVPEYLKAFMATATQTSEVDGLMSASSSVPRISLRGRKFRLIQGGEEIKKPADELYGVILGVEPGPNLFIKTYYEGAYNSGENLPPTCGSSDGISPDPWVTTPQHSRCSTCPKNQFGSATSRSGKKSKACRDSKRVWIALPEDIKGTVYAMNIPVTSLKNVSEYGKKLKVNGFPLSAVITKLSMEDSEFPLLEFEMAGFLNEDVGKIAIERNISKDWDISAAKSAPLLEDKTSSPPMLAQATSVAEEIVQAAPREAKPVSNATPGGESVDNILGNW